MYVFALALLSTPPIEKACVWIVDGLLYIVAQIILSVVYAMHAVPFLHYMLPFLLIFAITYYYAPGEYDDSTACEHAQDKLNNTVV